MERLSTVVARNSAFGMAAQGIIKVLSFGFSVLIVRQLGAESFGQYAAVLAFGGVFVFVADLGLGPYAVREVARARSHADSQARVSALFGNVLALRMALAVIASGLVISSAWLTARPPVMIGAIALGCLGLLMYALQGTCEAILSGFERLDLSARAKILNQLALVMVGATLLTAGTGYYGLVVGSLCGIGLMTLSCWRAVQRLGLRPLRPDLPLSLALLKKAMPFGVITLTLGLSYKFDTVLLNVFRGDAETGYYNAAYNLVFSAIIVSNVVNSALYPSLVRQASRSLQTLPRLCERALRYLLLLSLPIAVGGCAAADRLVPFLFSSSYGPSIGALQILIWVVPFMFASELLGYVVVVQGREGPVARAVVVSTALNVAANLVLVPRFGLIGAAVMTVATEAVLIGQYAWLVRDLLRSASWDLLLVRPMLSSLAMGAVILEMRAVPLALMLLAATMTYFGLLLAFRVVGPDELKFLRSLQHDTFKRKPAVA